MAKELKVYGGCYDGTYREIVATHTKKHAYELLRRGRNMGYKYFSDYTSKTGNSEEIAIASGEPFRVFKTRASAYDGVYIRVE